MTLLIDTNMTKAILFDLDGVLIETERETFEFYRTILSQHGIRLADSDFKYKAGRKSVDFWNDVLSDEQRSFIDTDELTQLKRQAFNANPEKYVKKIHGGREVLQGLQKAKYKLALTTQNEQQMAQTAMRWLGIENVFDVVLTLNDINNKKPDPEIYLLAADRLGELPTECVVVEDSKDGILSARSAKMHCVALRHEYTPAEHLKPAHTIIDDIRELTPAFVEALIQKNDGAKINAPSCSRTS